MNGFSKQFITALLSLLSLSLAVHAGAEPVAPVLARPALITKHASHSVLTAIALAGKRLVAVGERGIIVTSDDDGTSWRQSPVPVSVTLTAVHFADDQHGWAVGHSGVVLHSDDGGATWRVQLDGAGASALLLADAKRDGGQQAIKMATQFVADGPDKPFLDVRFDDASHGYVIGAYGLIFRTEDGGKHWQPWMSRVDNPKGLNLYRLQREKNTLYLAGEQGYFARSDDDGATFRRLPTPREASYFAMQTFDNGGLVVAGLRGTAFTSSDRGNSWLPLPIDSTESITSLLALHDGRLLYLDQAGRFSAGEPSAKTIKPIGSVTSNTITAAIQLSNGNLVTTGFRGIEVVNKTGLVSAPSPRNIK